MNLGQCVSTRICCTNCFVKDNSKAYSYIIATNGSESRNWLLESTISTCKGSYEPFRSDYGNVLVDKINISYHNFENNCLGRINNDGLSDYQIKYSNFAYSNSTEDTYHNSGGFLFFYNQFSILFCKFINNQLARCGAVFVVKNTTSDFLKNSKLVVYSNNGNVSCRDCNFVDNERTINIDRLISTGTFTVPFKFFFISTFNCYAEIPLKEDKVYVITCPFDTNSYLYKCMYMFIVAAL